VEPLDPTVFHDGPKQLLMPAGVQAEHVRNPWTALPIVRGSVVRISLSARRYRNGLISGSFRATRRWLRE
jgi:hypothetical protein